MGDNDPAMTNAISMMLHAGVISLESAARMCGVTLDPPPKQGFAIGDVIRLPGYSAVVTRYDPRRCLVEVYTTDGVSLEITESELLRQGVEHRGAFSEESVPGVVSRLRRFHDQQPEPAPAPVTVTRERSIMLD
jgi:hypothetical protein